MVSDDKSSLSITDTPSRIASQEEISSSLRLVLRASWGARPIWIRLPKHMAGQQSEAHLSYDAGSYIIGAAYVYNILGGDEQATWKAALYGPLKINLALFFINGIATDVSCGEPGKYNVEKQSMKGIFGQNLVRTIIVAPHTSETILQVIGSTAEAAAVAYTNNECPLEWNGSGTNNGTLGGASSAVSYTQGLLVGKAAAPGTISLGNVTGGPTPTTGGHSVAKLGFKMGMGSVVGTFGGMAWLILLTIER
ncbi:uncharacterized protein RSE6_12239 [Rhynchosporium secalis]|uniref:Uncharacterized protein n=1 Tax=Rhynchosporium secalis TaxID=38038 RepID=A0A1E1MPW7_RHYSE|nr:uncharacterized protein RSE6_12239 [Rhynchosporium secalis]